MRVVEPEDLKLTAQGRTLMAIDPGLGGVGLAYWDLHTWDTARRTPTETQVVRSKYPQRPWLQRAGWISERVARFYRWLAPEIVCIEGQSVWLGSEKSSASAARGDILKTTLLTGMILQGIGDANVRLLDSNDVSEVTVCIVPPNTWKGQLPKHAVVARIKRNLGVSYPDHVADAVGIGLYVMGEF